MAFEQNLTSISLPASGDLSSSQFFFGQVNSSGQVAVAAAHAAADGVIQNKPTAAGQAVQLAVFGVSKVVVGAGGTVTQGDAVAADSAGKAITATTGDYILGRALQTGAAGSTIAVLFQPKAKI